MNAPSLSTLSLAPSERDTLRLNMSGVSSLTPATMADLVHALRAASYHGRRVELVHVSDALAEQLRALRIDGLTSAPMRRVRPAATLLRRLGWAQ